MEKKYGDLAFDQCKLYKIIGQSDEVCFQKVAIDQQILFKRTVDEMKKRIQEVQGNTAGNYGECVWILRQFNWNVNNAISNVNSDKYSQEFYVELVDNPDQSMCCLCASDLSKKPIKLETGYVICSHECLKSYLETITVIEDWTNLGDKKQIYLDQCKIRIEPQYLSLLLNGPFSNYSKKALEVYDKFLFKCAVEESYDMQQCPSCKAVMILNDKKNNFSFNTRTFYCHQCKKFLCNAVEKIGEEIINCNEKLHQPCNCWMVKEFNILQGKSQEFDEISNLNVKECYYCKTRLYKESGCDHVVCGRDTHGGRQGVKGVGCKRDLCWLCMREINNGHNQSVCQNAVQEFLNKKKTTKQSVFKPRFETCQYFYYNLKQTADELMEKRAQGNDVLYILQEQLLIKGFPLITFNYYDEAMRILIEAKYCLSSCYLIYYYLNDKDNIDLMRLQIDILNEMVNKLTHSTNMLIMVSNYEEYNENKGTDFFKIGTDIKNLVSYVPDQIRKFVKYFQDLSSKIPFTPAKQAIPDIL